MVIKVHPEDGYPVEIYTYEDFINYDPHKHIPFFWLTRGQKDYYPPENKDEDQLTTIPIRTIIFSEDDYIKSQKEIEAIYWRKAENLFHKIKACFNKRWNNSGNRELLRSQEIALYRTLLENDNSIDGNNTTGSILLLDIRLPFTSEIMGDPKWPYGEIPEEGEELLTRFTQAEIREIRSHYQQFIIDGYKCYSHIAPNNHHLDSYKTFIRIEAFNMFYQWLKNLPVMQANTTIKDLQKKETDSAPKHLKDLFKDSNMFDKAVSVLKKVDPAIIGEDGLFLRNKYVFAIWYHYLIKKHQIKSEISDDTVARLICEEFSISNLDSSILRKHDRSSKIADKYKTDIEVLFSQLSQSSQRTIKGK